ncbi:MAG: hypothetical protein RL885_14695 [Planctomycetota bacterium]
MTKKKRSEAGQKPARSVSSAAELEPVKMARSPQLLSFADELEAELEELIKATKAKAKNDKKQWKYPAREVIAIWKSAGASLRSFASPRSKKDSRPRTLNGRGLPTTKTRPEERLPRLIEWCRKPHPVDLFPRTTAGNAWEAADEQIQRVRQKEREVMTQPLLVLAWELEALRDHFRAEEKRTGKYPTEAADRAVELALEYASDIAETSAPLIEEPLPTAPDSPRSRIGKLILWCKAECRNGLLGSGQVDLRELLRSLEALCEIRGESPKLLDAISEAIEIEYGKAAIESAERIHRRLVSYWLSMPSLKARVDACLVRSRESRHKKHGIWRVHDLARFRMLLYEICEERGWVDK